MSVIGKKTLKQLWPTLLWKQQLLGASRRGRISWKIMKNMKTGKVSKIQKKRNLFTSLVLFSNSKKCGVHRIFPYKQDHIFYFCFKEEYIFFPFHALRTVDCNIKNGFCFNWFRHFGKWDLNCFLKKIDNIYN